MSGMDPKKKALIMAKVDSIVSQWQQNLRGTTIDAECASYVMRALTVMRVSAIPCFHSDVLDEVRRRMDLEDGRDDHS